MMEWLTLKVMRTLEHIVNTLHSISRKGEHALVFDVLLDRDRVLLQVSQLCFVGELEDERFARWKSARMELQSQYGDLVNEISDYNQ